MLECFPKHSGMGTARMKLAKETNEKGKKRDVSKERVRHERNEVPTAYHYLICIIKRAVFLRPSVHPSVTPFSN